MKRIWVICVLSVMGLWAANDKGEMAKQRAAASYGKLPLSFERNEGQADSRVRFLARGRGYGLFLTRREAVLSLVGQDKQRRAVLHVGLGHAAAGGADPVGVDALDGKSNYFSGKDPKQWHTGVSNYTAVKYAGVYPGIDLIYHGNQGQLEYDFNVAPGADPRRIELRFQGARKLRINDMGELVVGLSGSELIEHRPVVYQEAEGRRELVAGEYMLLGRDRVGFRLARYDRKRAVVIDPALVYSTYLGGSSLDSATAIAVDAAGNAYITGGTSSANFPASPGAVQTSPKHDAEAFVVKLNDTGSALLYSTYLGGTGYDFGAGIAISAIGNAYVTGYTDSPDFPVTPGAFQASLRGISDAFVTQLNSTGSALLYSSFLGGSDASNTSSTDRGTGIAIDTAGNAYVTGYTDSTDFPVTFAAFRTRLGGNVAAFVTKLNAAGSALLYSTYLAGSNQYSYGSGIAVDDAGSAYIVGSTSSTSFPVTPGAFQTSLSGGYYSDAFITKLNTTGSALVYSTYLGGGNSDAGNGIAVDATGNAYVTGQTDSPDFPVTPGAFQKSGFGDAFVTKLNANGSALLYSTFLGGNGLDYGNSVAIDAAVNAYITGGTSSSDFPVTLNAFQPYFGKVGDTFVTKLDTTGSALLYSTYLSAGSYGEGIAVGATGSAYVTGVTYSAPFPVTAGAFQTSFGGAVDAFVVKLDTTQIGPIITFTGVLPGPPKQIQLSSQDLQSGLASIQVLQCTNCTAVTDNFAPGTKDAVKTTATKTDQTKTSAVQIEATDLNGNSTILDPADITIQADGRTEIQSVRISGLEHLVVITNGTPGVRAIVLRVRGKDVPVLVMKDGETRTIDIAAELVAGRSNEVAVLSWGRRGAGASVVFTQP